MTRQPAFPDAVFQRELQKSYLWMDVVTKAFIEAGVLVDQAERRFRADVEQIASFTRSEKDLVLSRSGACIEVKSRNESWTCPADFPYPTIIVDTVSGFDAKAVVPLAYVHVSTVTRAMSVVPVTRARVWSRQRRYDRIRKISDDFYETDARQMMTFGWLVELCLGLEALEDASRRQAFLADRGF